jgi:hypothetical protein
VNDSAENGVFFVEVRSFAVANEKL